MGFIGAPLCYLGFRAGKRMRTFEWMKWTCLFTLAVILTLGAAAGINARAAFVFLHKILFTNAYWAFNVKKDPVILILPEEIFLAAAIEMGVFVLAALLILLIRYTRCKKAVFSGKSMAKSQKKTGKNRR